MKLLQQIQEELLEKLLKIYKYSQRKLPCIHDKEQDYLKKKEDLEDILDQVKKEEDDHREEYLKNFYRLEDKEPS